MYFWRCDLGDLLSEDTWFSFSFLSFEWNSSPSDLDLRRFFSLVGISDRTPFFLRACIFWRGFISYLMLLAVFD